jgi:hypothetical protein
MPISRYPLVIVSVLLVLLFAYDACICVGKDLAPAVSDVVARRWPGTDDFRLTADVTPAASVDVTPAARVRETFPMFLPGDYKRMRDTARSLAGSARPQG